MSKASSYDAPFLHDVVTQTTECILTVDDQRTVVFANSAIAETFGYTADEIVGTPFDRLVRDVDPLEQAHRVNTERSDTETTDPRRITMVHESGRPVTVYCSVKPIEHGQQRYYTITVQETALEDRNEPTEVETERLIQQVLEQSPNPVLVCNHTDGRIVDCNDPAGELVSSSSDDLVGRSIFGLVHEDDRRFIEFTEQMAETGSVETIETTCIADDEERIPVTVSASMVAYGGRHRLLAHVHERADATADGFDTSADELASLSQRGDARTAAIEASIDGIALLNDDEEFVFLNEAHAEVYGYDEPADLVGESWRRLYGDTETRRFENQILPEVYETGNWRGEAVGMRADGSTFAQELSLACLDTGGIVCVVRDISQRKDDQHLADEQLRRLNEACQALMDAEQRETIAELCVDTVERLFDCDTACVRLLDADASEFEMVAETDTAAELQETWPACDLERTFAGQAYRRDDVVVQSADASDALAETPIAASAHLPLGEFGVLTVASTETASFADVDIEGAKMLASTVESALNRAEREAELRARAEDLERRYSQLESIDQINTLVHQLVGDLFLTDSREEIEQRVCDRLAASRLYQSAWIAEQSITGDGVSIAATAGVNEATLEAVEDLSVGAIGDGLVQRALDNDEVVSERRYDVVEPTDHDDSREEIRAIAAVPIQYDDRTYGVLVVNAVHEDAFETVGTDSLEMLGDVVGFALTSVHRKQLLLSDKVVQLEFEVTDPDCLAVRITEELECYCRIRRTVKTNDDTFLNYVRIDGVDAEKSAETIEEIDGVLGCRIVSENANDCIIEVERETCGAEVMMEYGATAKCAEAENGVGTLVIETPRTADVREIADAYTQYNPGSELIVKRDVERPVQTAAEFRETIEQALTEKQQSAVTSAYYSGYYDWPRESTGEEVAESMGISSATLHQHLRIAHRRLLAAFLCDDSSDDRTERPTCRLPENPNSQPSDRE